MSQISNLTVVSSKHTVCVRKAAENKDSLSFNQTFKRKAVSGFIISSSGFFTFTVHAVMVKVKMKNDCYNDHIKRSKNPPAVKICTAGNNLKQLLLKKKKEREK